MSKLTAISRFPIKGLSAEHLPTITLTQNKTLPHDRAWAIENGGGQFDPQNPTHLKKKHFLMLAWHSALARLDCKFDESALQYLISLDGKDAMHIHLEQPRTHMELFDMLRDLLGDHIRGDLRLIHSPAQAMTDIKQPHISLINMMTVKDLAHKSGLEIEAARFRGNLLINGLKAGEELNWVGRTIRIGDTVLKVEAKIGRCTATNVNLKTGRPDMDLPAELRKAYGHTHCGIYLNVETGGQISIGDQIILD